MSLISKTATTWPVVLTNAADWLASEGADAETDAPLRERYFLRWMERFPDIASVAQAPEEDLLKAWEGLGYYRRARNVQFLDHMRTAVDQQHQSPPEFRRQCRLHTTSVRFRSPSSGCHRFRRAKRGNADYFQTTPSLREKMLPQELREPPPPPPRLRAGPAARRQGRGTAAAAKNGVVPL